jgi:hypothetical protein
MCRRPEVSELAQVVFLAHRGEGERTSAGWKFLPGKTVMIASVWSFTAKPEKVCPIRLFLKVAAPWGRGDLGAAASGYSISGFAIEQIDI